MAPHGRANVIASSEPLDDSGLTAEDYARRQHLMLDSEFPEFRTTVDLMPISVQGAHGTAWFSEFTWTPENAEPVTQMQVYAVRPGRGYTATATALTADFEDNRDELFDMLMSMVIEGSAAGAGPSLVPMTRGSTR
ncbi:MAG: hypothetical protein HOY78_30480 [Saccharothrix sp.]|nr:hypothetical protein [Saccharothrix sp.]